MKHLQIKPDDTKVSELIWPVLQLLGPATMQRKQKFHTTHANIGSEMNSSYNDVT